MTEGASSHKPAILLALAVGILAVLFFGLKMAGFHLEHGRLVRGGDILISPVPENVRFFLDNRRIYPDTEGSGLFKNIAPGDHSILIFNEEDWPWLKNITIGSGTTTTIAPFLISKNPSGDIINESDAAYDTHRNDILAETLPSKSVPLVSKSGNISVWIEGNTVMATWNGTASSVPPYFCTSEDECPQTMTVTKSQTDIRSLNFYKDRDDVLLIASQNGVFAIELDHRGGTQNFQPIYKGAGLPRFMVADQNTIYVLDGSILLAITI